MTFHPYSRTERDLQWLADNFSSQNIMRGLPERLECLAAWHRMVIEAEKSANREPNNFEIASKAYAEAFRRLPEVGVGPTEGEYAFSPCLGPDLPEE